MVAGTTTPKVVGVAWAAAWTSLVEVVWVVTWTSLVEVVWVAAWISLAEAAWAVIRVGAWAVATSKVALVVVVVVVVWSRSSSRKECKLLKALPRARVGDEDGYNIYCNILKYL
jgi:hypothetical protein